MWVYKGEEFFLPDDKNIIGFVYCITDTISDKKYIGKKVFYSTRKLPPLKGKKRKRTKIVESDWMSYYGSSDIVNKILQESGTERFHREILYLCNTKAEMSYLELLEQIRRNVLFREDYYNNIIQVRIHGSHVNTDNITNKDRLLINTNKNNEE